MTANTTGFDEVEVAIVGGSYAGLSAGMVLGRSLRTALIIDSGRPCNRQTPQAHNFLTRDGDTPANLLSIAKAQVLRYPTLAFQHGKVDAVEKQGNRFRVSLEAGEVVFANRVLLATGVADQMPDIPGFADCWGISVLHCPYCHGYEVRHQQLGLLGNGDMGYEMTRLIYNWSKSLTLFTNGPATLSSEQVAVLKRKGIPIVESNIVEIAHEHGHLRAVLTNDGTQHEMDAMFARVPFKQHSNLAQQLGCAQSDMGLIVVDEFGQTSVEGVYAAGDSTTVMRQIAFASAAGAKAGAWINMTLVEKSFDTDEVPSLVTQGQRDEYHG